jgi:hypothetical protein
MFAQESLAVNSKWHDIFTCKKHAAQAVCSSLQHQTAAVHTMCWTAATGDHSRESVPSSYSLGVATADLLRTTFDAPL